MSDVHQRIETIVKGHPFVLFMKGDAHFPMCGFSGRAIQILKASGMNLQKLVTVNVLADEEIRQGIKDYSQWPTIPQLYVKGELCTSATIIGSRGGFITAPDYSHDRASIRVQL